jgi:ClpP class serine protease
MKCLNVLTALYNETWLILPSVHRKLCEIVAAHVSGIAHDPGGISSAYADIEPEKYKAEMVGSIAIIPILGVLGKGVGDLAKSSGATDIDDIGAELDRVMADPEVKEFFST